MKTLIAIAVFLFLTEPAVKLLAQTQTARFNLTWTNGTPNPDGSNTPTGTKVFRSDTGAAGTYNLIFTVPWPQNTYQDQIQNDTGGKIYCYQVRATNSAGDSDPSNTSCGSSNAVPPASANLPNKAMQLVITILPPINVKP